jgi:hypothetical protein
MAQSNDINFTATVLSRLSLSDQKTLYSVPTTEGTDPALIPSDAVVDPEGSPDA